MSDLRVVDDPLWLAAVLSVLMGLAALLALLAGLLFVMAPKWVLMLNRGSGRWISMRRPSYPLERNYPIEPWIYRHHRLVGSLLLLACAYLLHHLAFRYQHEVLLKLAGGGVLADWLLHAAWWFALFASLMVLAVASVLALRPSALKGIEGMANRWFSSRRAMQSWEQPRFGPDNLVARFPRIFGLVLLLAALYLLLVAFSLGLSG